MITALLAAGAAAVGLAYVESSAGLYETPPFEAGDTEFEMADLDGDGHVDLLSIGDHGNPLIGSGEEGVMVWLGDGRGNWTYRHAGHFGYGGIAAGDLDGDGTADIAYGMHHDYSGTDLGDQLLEAARGDGTGTGWLPWDDGLAEEGQDWGMFSTDLADVEADGALDIGSGGFGASDGLHVYLNQLDGSWRRGFGYLGGNSGNVFGFGEIDGDGFPDIGASKQEGTAWVGDGEGFFLVADGTLPPVGGWGYREGVSLGDVDADGHDDLAWCDASSNPQVWLWRPGNAWQSASAGLPADGRCQRTAISDMNGDGSADLVTLGSARLRVLSGDGAGTAWTLDADVTLPDSPGDANALRVGGDVDHNGLPDVVVVTTQRVDLFNVRNRVRCYREASTAAGLGIRVVRPGPNRTLLAGSVDFVDWAAAVPEGESARIEIELSTAGEQGPWSVVAEDLANAGRFQWRVPDSLCEECRLRITATSASAIASAVGAPFRIARRPDRLSLRLPDRGTILIGDALSRDRANLYRSDWERFLATGEYTQDPDTVPQAARFCALTGGAVSDPFLPAPGTLVFYLATAFRLHEDGQVPGQKVPLAESRLGQDSGARTRSHAHRCP